GLWGNEPGCKAWTAVAVLTPRRILQCWSEPEPADRPPSTRRYENGWLRGSHFQPPPRSLRWQCNPAGLVRKPNSWPRPFRSRPHNASGPPRHHRHFSGRLPRRLHCDLHVLPERSQELDQPPDGEIASTVAHQRRHVRLLDAESLAGLHLGQAARLDDPVDLQRQTSLEQLLFRIWHAEVSEDIAAHPGFGFRSSRHVQSFPASTRSVTLR